MEISVWSVDWHSLLIPKIPLMDSALRTVVVYLVLQGGMRLLGRENLQQGATYKMVTLFLVGAFGGRAVLGEDTSMTSCVLGLGILLSLNALTAWAIFHSPRFASWMEGPVKVHLIRQGVLQVDAMLATKTTDEMLLARLRGRGVADLGRVQEAYLERHGEITFILRDG